jgi:uncharacterized membrane protein YgdD (TMEM256/DUF423 family)
MNMITEILHLIAALSVLLILAGFYMGMLVDAFEQLVKPAMWSFGTGVITLLGSLYMLSP